ncbi:uncharacterized protein [Diabrotica undecimpunctata]|uniref:uncharacterized protein n=1 Tax=Diabrotica undecimpunctata TaxID=50387 RepID=UPI003B63FC56
MGYPSSSHRADCCKVERYKRSIRKQMVKNAKENTENVLEQEGNNLLSMAGHTDPEEVIAPDNNSDKNTQTEITMEKLTEYFLKLAIIEETDHINNKTALNFKNLCGNDTKTRYYTGLSNFKVFIVVINYIKPFVPSHPNIILSIEDQILLTLVKLRLNPDFNDLGYRFGVSPTTASSYFKKIIGIMCIRFKRFVRWPEREILLKTMPKCFKHSDHEKTTVIIDCFEMKIQVASNLLSSAQSWSNYKQSHTLKYLIGITTQGSI